MPQPKTSSNKRGQKRPRTNKAVLLYRTSSDSQNEITSQARQKNNVIAEAKRQNLTPVREFGEVASGVTTDKRTVFLEMLDFVDDPDNEIDSIIFDDLSRFSRHDYFPMEKLKELRRQGIRVFSHAEGGLINTRKMDMLVRVKVWQNNEVSRATSTFTKEGLRTTAQKGLYPFGTPPYGYKKEKVLTTADGRVLAVVTEEEQSKKGEKGYQKKEFHYRLKPHPEQEEIVKRIAWMYDQGTRVMEIVQYLNTSGIPSPSGGIWTTSSVRTILKNKVYAGFIVIGKTLSTMFDDGDEYLEDEEWEDDSYLEVPNCHEPLIPLEQWERIQQRRAANGRRPKDEPNGPGVSSPRSTASPNPLSERIVCGYCGSNMTVSTRKTLTCSRKKNSGVSQCSKKDCSLFDILERITLEVHERVITPDVIMDQIELVKKNAHVVVNQELERKAGIEKRIKEIRKKRENVEDFIKEHGASDPRVAADLMKTLRELRDESDRMESQLSNIDEVATEAQAFLSNPEQVIQIATHYKTFLYSDDKAAVREFLRLFIRKVVLFDDNADIEYSLPLPETKTAEGKHRSKIDFSDPGFLLEQGWGARMAVEEMLALTFTWVSSRFRTSPVAAISANRPALPLTALTVRPVMAWPLPSRTVE